MEEGFTAAMAICRSYLVFLFIHMPGFLWEGGGVFKCTLFNYFSGVSINCKTQNRLIRIRPHRDVYNSDFGDVTNE